MKKIVFTMVAAMPMTFAMAQTTNKDKCPKLFTAADRTEMMTSKLGLNKKQATKLQQLNEQYKDVAFQHGQNFGPRGKKHRGFKGEAPKANCCEGNVPQGQMPLPQLTEKDKAKFEAKLKEVQAKRLEYDEKLKDILSDSQYAEYQKMQPKHPEKK